VPVYGNWDISRECLEHLRRRIVDHAVIVFDDGVIDDTVARLHADYPGVTVIALPTNGGFAAACNAGILRGTGDIVILVNNDVQANPTMLERLAMPCATNYNLGSAAPLLFAPNGTIDAVGLCADPTMAGFLR